MVGCVVDRSIDCVVGCVVVESCVVGQPMHSLSVLLLLMTGGIVMVVVEVDPR